MTRLVMVVIAFVSLAGAAAAAAHKILVLPLDGNADPATRGKLSARIARLAHGLDGQVVTGETTFADTALAVGCDPQAAGCSDLVMATLGVDELVWGTASKDGAQTRLVVKRAARGQVAHEIVAMLPAGDAGERVDGAVAPLFAGASRPPAARDEPASPPPAREPTAIAPPAREPAAPADTPVPTGAPGPSDRQDRSVGIALVAGGGVALALGIALLASYASTQSSIDHHATHNRADFDDLLALESKASTYAVTGDIAIVVGLAAGGLGAYYLYRDHQRHRVAITPAPIGRGAGLVLTIGGLP